MWGINFEGDCLMEALLLRVLIAVMGGWLE